MILIKFGNCQILEIDEAQKKLKKWLTNILILRYLNFIKPFILYTDTSKRGVNAILAQYDTKAKVNYVIEYFSHSLEQVQENWSATDLKCLVIIEVV